MNIIECKEMQRIKKHELIPTVIDHIFTICKEDKNFNTNSKADKIDDKLNQAKKQISKHKSLLNQSEKIKKELLEKIKNLDDESFKIKYKVLEILGSDI